MLPCTMSTLGLNDQLVVGRGAVATAGDSDCCLPSMRSVLCAVVRWQYGRRVWENELPAYANRPLSASSIAPWALSSTLSLSRWAWKGLLPNGPTSNHSQLSAVP